jgi:hypothetical protein
MWAIGVPRAPIPKDQRPSDAIEIKGTPAHYSVAPGRRPVNHFQIDPAVNFRNNNGSGFQAPRLRNGVGKIAILAHRFNVLLGFRRSESICKTKPVKNSFDANPREVNPRAALRSRGQINHAIDMPRSQPLAAASEFGKNPPHQAPG